MDIGRLSAGEIRELAKRRCKAHGVRYLEHPSCWDRECGGVLEERIGFLDIEATNLDADFGYILTYAIKGLGEKGVRSYAVRSKDIKRNEPDKSDKDLIKRLVRDMMMYDRLVTHYGNKFDIPFIRTRALYCGVEFPGYREIYQDDTWEIARRKLKLHSNRLENIAIAILGGSQKTRIMPCYWIGAIRGDDKCIDYILDHNIRDVIELEKVWLKVRRFIGVSKRSI